MSRNCPGCKLFIIPYKNMYNTAILCGSCKKQENKLDEKEFFLKRWYYRYTVEFGVRDMEWFEAIFINIFACILFYSLIYQALQIIIEMCKFCIDSYKSLTDYLKAFK